MKKRYVVIALTALIVLAALLALLWRDGESDPNGSAAPAVDASSPSLSKDDGVQTQTAQQSDNESEQSDIEERETAAPAAAKTYNFLTWQDALDEYARWIGNE